jgi:predicted PurR-regulated permease PerM
MDFLRSLLGMFTSSVLRLAVTVGIMVAAYFLFVRPILDTTNKAIDQAGGFNNALNANVNQSLQQSNVNPSIARQIRRSIRRTNRQVQRQLNRSLRQTQAAPNQRRQTRLLRCVQRAHGNVNRMQRCARRF